MGKLTVSEAKAKRRHNPLYRDIESQGGNLRSKLKSRSKDNEVHDDDEYLDALTSRRILELAKEQQDELEREQGSESRSVGFLEKIKNDESEEDEDDENLEQDSEVENFSTFDDEVVEDEIEVDEKDAALFEKFLNNQGDNNGSVNLADKIMAKLQERQVEEVYTEREEDGVLLPPKVIAAYQKIGQILTTYTHGKLPKLFKVLPTLRNWEDVLYVTNPEAWTPHAVYEATKLFVSNLPANEAQKFVESVLLERFRTSIEESEDHSLNYHLYRALKKSLYKPGAFFKGFLFPLVDSHCSVREATIAASILAKVSVPVLHSSVALTQLLQREFKPSTTVFIRVLIEKKYALPYQTLDELVFYFMRFRRAAQSLDMMEDEKAEELPPLPIVWHKAFLSFAQRYKNDITDDQRDFLLETVRQRFHHAIGPEIRRELLAGSARVLSTKKDNSIMIDAF